MLLSQDESHLIKNKLAITIGLIELVVKKLKKNEVHDIPEIIERLERALNATENANQILKEKSKLDSE